MDTDLTGVLKDLHGSPDAIEKVLPLVYRELRAIAAVQLRQERAGHTLFAVARAFSCPKAHPLP